MSALQLFISKQFCVGNIYCAIPLQKINTFSEKYMQRYKDHSLDF